MIFILLSLTAFLFCFVTTPMIRNAFLARGLVDQPDTERKLHRIPVPRSGGIGIILSYFAAFGVAYACTPADWFMTLHHVALLKAVLPATALMFGVGLLDDLQDLRPRYKLLGQTLVALLAVGLGARLTLHHGPAWISFAISVLWLLLCTNAMNLIDGMDGLATGVGLTATLTTLLVALLSGNGGLAVATAPLAGALLAFLRYNFSPASVFLGDSGSLTIGFLLGCLGLVWSGNMGGLGMLGPLLALGLPLLDVSLSIVRRYLRRVPIFKGDRGHIHHRVQDLGLSVRAAAWLLYGCCAMFATLAVLRSMFSGWWSVLFFAGFAALAIWGVHQLRYVEFRAARRSLSYAVIRRAVHEEIHLEDMRRALELAVTAEDCWNVIRSTCDELHISMVQLRLCGQRFSQHRLTTRSEPQCTVHVPLGEDSWVLMTAPLLFAPRAITAALQPLRVALETRFSTENSDIVAKRSGADLQLPDAA